MVPNHARYQAALLSDELLNLASIAYDCKAEAGDLQESIIARFVFIAV